MIPDVDCRVKPRVDVMRDIRCRKYGGVLYGTWVGVTYETWLGFHTGHRIDLW